MRGACHPSRPRQLTAGGTQGEKGLSEDRGGKMGVNQMLSQTDRHKVCDCCIGGGICFYNLYSLKTSHPSNNNKKLGGGGGGRGQRGIICSQIFSKCGEYLYLYIF